ncbi:Leucine aminopeptidase 2 [Colletotrichum tanaceti]|uniref:Peptide hydrolase n=1 Tax=Colletotrichum tanaceti TaxID=1306861 RepID=A0A4V6DI15_9PEZI|nr:Leucine aminopeptidase 2 [Colletotrichum tanaceti]TKW58696.1 Leucine aminopeptidase 2 [Colletotrichum tanaceti]
MKFSQSAAALLSLAASGAAATNTTCRPKIDSDKLQADLTTDNLMANLEALNKIAFANGGNRAFGLPGYAASVDYVWDRVSQIPATRAWKQDFPATFGQVTSIDLQVEDESVYVFGLTYSPSTSEEGITAEIVLGPDGAAGCDAANYAGLDVRDKIVLVQRFRCPTGGTLAGRVRPAAAAGAAAVIVYHDITTNATAGSLSAPDPNGFVPAGFINLADGLKIKERLDAGETVQGHFQQTQIVEERITQNVFVETEEGDPHNVIMLGAHLDSVQAGPGINDDGSGTSLLLELFLASTQYRTKNKVRFAWWGAEENGLLGSKYYCSNLAASDVDDLLVYLNFDMVAKGYIGVADTDGSTHGSAGPAGSDVVEHIYQDYFRSQGIAVTPAVVTNGSDYASFWQILNKPFGFLHTGTGVAQDPCYHQACDTIDNPDPTTITINAKAAAHILTVLSLNGTALIPKTSVNATMLSHLQSRSLGLDIIQIEELEALGERHLGCGHDI